MLAARRWHIANRIRREKKGGAKERILKYLIENVKQVVTSEELAYVAGSAKEFGRRARELRTEEGYYVATRFTGRPALRSGEYVLESIERVAEPHDRHIPKEVQEEVYARDQNTCRSRGWNREKWTKEDPRFLELHHLLQKASEWSISHPTQRRTPLQTKPMFGHLFRAEFFPRIRILFAIKNKKSSK